MSKIDSNKSLLVCPQDVNSSNFLSRNNTLIFTVPQQYNWWFWDRYVTIFHACVLMNACCNSKPMKLSLSEFVQYNCQAKAAKETQLAKVYIFLFFSALMALELCINFYRFLTWHVQSVINAKHSQFIEWCSSLLMMFESSSGIPFSR